DPPREGRDGPRAWVGLRPPTTRRTPTVPDILTKFRHDLPVNRTSSLFGTCPIFTYPKIHNSSTNSPHHHITQFIFSCHLLAKLYSLALYLKRAILTSQK